MMRIHLLQSTPRSESKTAKHMDLAASFNGVLVDIERDPNEGRMCW